MTKTKVTRTKGKCLEWMRGTNNKKYKVVIHSKDGSKKTVQFGDKRYEHFKDTTPLKLYTRLNHGDKKRRKNYRARHGASGYQTVPFSPAWFSWNYLW